jgi:hypothetical protein
MKLVKPSKVDSWRASLVKKEYPRCEGEKREKTHRGYPHNKGNANRELNSFNLFSSLM